MWLTEYEEVASVDEGARLDLVHHLLHHTHKRRMPTTQLNILKLNPYIPAGHSSLSPHKLCSEAHVFIHGTRRSISMLLTRSSFSTSPLSM
jgi:hypothetical protein